MHSTMAGHVFTIAEEIKRRKKCDRQDYCNIAIPKSFFKKCSTAFWKPWVLKSGFLAPYGQNPTCSCKSCIHLSFFPAKQIAPSR